MPAVPLLSLIVTFAASKQLSKQYKVTTDESRIFLGMTSKIIDGRDSNRLRRELNCQPAVDIMCGSHAIIFCAAMAYEGMFSQIANNFVCEMNFYCSYVGDKSTFYARVVHGPT